MSFLQQFYSFEDIDIPNAAMVRQLPFHHKDLFGRLIIAEAIIEDIRQTLNFLIEFSQRLNGNYTCSLLAGVVYGS